MQNGWVKLHRQLLDKPIWQCSTLEQRVILIVLLLMANHKENEWAWEGKKFNVKAGQFITSANSIAKNCGEGVSRQNIRTALDKFERYEFLTKESTKTGMLITIANWSFYQSNDEDVTKSLTVNQPTANQQLTTNKNDKNEKKENTYPDDFETFYQLYPRPENKRQTFNNWKKACKTQSINKILQAAENYKSKVTKDRTDKQYMKSSSNFLGRDEVYVDYLPENFKGPNPGMHAKPKPIEIKNNLDRFK